MVKRLTVVKRPGKSEDGGKGWGRVKMVERAGEE